MANKSRQIVRIVLQMCAIRKDSQEKVRTIKSLM